ncbi:MAG TPA: hypothetical protein VGH16_01930 [Candidatus Binatia bacterium]|jgi:hypothetical protein
MKDVTLIFNNYRECVRNLWNVYFWNLQPDWDPRDKYEDICTTLFDVLVLDQVVNNTKYSKSPAYLSSREPLKIFRIVPLLSDQTPIHINRDKKRSPYWDHPTNVVKPDDVDLRFIDYFDFDLLGRREYKYFLVRIVASKTNEDLVGRDALIECAHISIHFDETA